MRFCIFPVRNSGRRKLKPARIRVRQRDGDKSKLAAILTDGFESLNFLFGHADGFIFSGKAGDK